MCWLCNVFWNDVHVRDMRSERVPVRHHLRRSALCAFRSQFMDWDQNETTIYWFLVNSFRLPRQEFFVNKQQYKIGVSANHLFGLF